MTKEEVIQQFRELLAAQDADQAWAFEELDFSAFTEEEELEMAMELFGQSWHQLHDALASKFQLSRSPMLSTFLYKAVRNNKIPEFDYHFY